MNCEKPIRITKNLDRSIYPDGLEVGCGKCLLCRITKRKEWTIRLLHENSAWDQSIFVTLTYTDENLPHNSSVEKKELQKFFKRLRKHLGERKIKYFATGEYGTESQRPHYHAIIFGMGLNMLDKRLIMDSWPYADWTVNQIQKYAFGTVTPDSIQYVAKYVTKKLSGEMALEEYDLKFREPVFQISSQGLGINYAIQNLDKITEDGYIPLRGVPHSIPRYYINRLDISMDNAKQKNIERQREYLESINGISLTKDEQYRQISSIDHVVLERAINGSASQKAKNIKAIMDLKKSKI